jgi:hypothetical protein
MRVIVLFALLLTLAAAQQIDSLSHLRLAKVSTTIKMVGNTVYTNIKLDLHNPTGQPRED